MRVMVTGGTGFLGGHVVRALVDEGHEPQLLVRDVAKLQQLIELFGLPHDIAFTVGDVRDAASVTAALDGADACIHAAAFTTLDAALMDRCLEVNGPGARIVLDSAVAAGCDPVLHVSTISCIFPPSGGLIDGADAVRSSDAPYSKSKAEADLHARELQAAGHPVVIVYPGGVIGPGDLGFNVLAMYLTNMLASDTLMSGPTGGGGLVDVRDLGVAIARLMRPGLGGRRFVATGNCMSFAEQNAIYNEVTGLDRAIVETTREALLAVMDPEAVDLMLDFVPGATRPSSPRPA